MVGLAAYAITMNILELTFSEIGPNRSRICRAHRGFFIPKGYAETCHYFNVTHQVNIMSSQFGKTKVDNKISKVFQPSYLYEIELRLQTVNWLKREHQPMQSLSRKPNSPS